MMNDTTQSEATGFSATFSLEEAIEDAVRKLAVTPMPDELVSVDVTNIGATFGGIAGLRRLAVTVKKAHQQ